MDAERQCKSSEIDVKYICKGAMSQHRTGLMAPPSVFLYTACENIHDL